MSVITALDTYDVRFPTSLHLDGSDAMNPDPDYSAAYVVLRTDAQDGLEGHGFAFTIGRGNDVQVAAIRALEPFIVDLPLDETLASLGDVYRRLTHDSQLRWLGPEKGVMHMAVARGRQRALGPRRQARGQAAVEAVVGPFAGAARRARRLPVPDRRAHARRGAGDPAARRARPRGARGPAPARRLSRLHHDARLARLLRREARPPVHARPSRPATSRSSSRSAPTSTTTSAACGSRARPAGRTSASPSTPTSAGTSATRCAGSARSRPFDPVLDRGADEPGRRARPRRDPARGGADPGRDRRARAEPRDVQAADAGRGDRHRPDRRGPGRGASTRTSRSCCSRRSSGCRSARTPAASACASWCSTSRCSTTSPSPAPSRAA